MFTAVIIDELYHADW